MANYQSFILLLILLSLQVWCQTVQDGWTAPASPDGSTNLQGGNPFTIRWKSSLKESFATYCTACDITRLDLWITSFSSQDYKFKIAGSIDITTTLSYDWDGNMPIAALSATDDWVLRFTPYGTTDPFTDQISSSGFLIDRPPQPSTIVNTVTAQPSSASSSTPSSSSIASTSSSTSASTTSSPTETSTLPVPVPPPTSKAWIAGVVVGSIIGIAIGAGLLWFLTGRKRQNKMSQQQDQQQQSQANEGYTHGGFYDPANWAKKKYTNVGVHRPTSPQPSEMVGDSAWRGQHPAEVAGSSPNPAPPAELWHRNYRSS